MKFSTLMKHTNPELYISPIHDKWLAQNSDASYSAEAMALAAQELGKPDRDRRKGFSASSVTTCGRQQQFTYLGMPQLPPTERLASIFHNGSFTHLRWQMAGLSAGWLLAAEVPIGENPMGLKGTADGLCADGSLLEIKSINSNGYRGVAQFGPKFEHTFQLATYMMAMDIEVGRFIYENKDTQDYVEIPFALTDEMREEISVRAHWLWEETNSNRLIEPLEKCIDHEGKYKTCPYKNSCLGINSWEEAQTFVRISA